MHSADEFTHIREQIARLTARAASLRQEFLEGRASLRSNAREVLSSTRRRSELRLNELPAPVLTDPAMWRHGKMPGEGRMRVGIEDDSPEIELIERF